MCVNTLTDPGATPEPYEIRQPPTSSVGISIYLPLVGSPEGLTHVNWPETEGNVLQYLDCEVASRALSLLARSLEYSLPIPEVLG